MLEEFQGNDRFSILRRLGAGGMGIVYEAYDEERRTRVALKTLRNVDPAAVYRFKVEFRALAELSHENLLPLYELVSDGDRWFFTMELLEGATDLMTWVRGEGSGHVAPSAPTRGASAYADATISGGTQPMLTPAPIPIDPGATALFPLNNDERTVAVPGEGDLTSVFAPDLAGAAGLAAAFRAGAASPEVAVDYDRLRSAFFAVAQGVRALHAAGKIHRDLKPENVMVRTDGRPVLLDFGLILQLQPQGIADADSPDAPRRYTAQTDHTISGTLRYMAPEQAMDTPLSEGSDWYAFGVMLFEALTGRLPFIGKGIQVLQAKLNHDAPRASHYAPDTPPDLDELCAELLSRDPDKRPAGEDILRRIGGEASAGELPARHDGLFVGRERYLEALNRHFARLADGHAGVVCVHGHSGVGKTALIQQFLAHTVAAQGACLLDGRCYEQESVPYKALDNLMDVLARLLLEMPATQVSAMLPRNIHALARVFPVLQQVRPIVEAGGGAGKGAMDPRLVRQQAVEALAELLDAIGSERPLVLYIDDLQWGDTDSALLLAGILARQPVPRMLLLLSFRSEYAGNACLCEFRRTWEAGSAPCEEIEVLPLSREESRELAERLLAGSTGGAAIERIVEEARGSAFFVQELAEFARSGLEWQSGTTAMDLDEVLWRRVRQLPLEARQLLEMVAIAGQPIQIRDLVQTRTLRRMPQHAVNLLRSARLVRSTGARLSDEIETFHDRVRESVASHLKPAVSRDYHEQLAGALEANGETAPETIASHLQAADSPRASHFYELAGERAVHVLAFERAEEYLKLAAQLAPEAADRARVEERLIHFYTDTARFQQAYEVGSDAVARFGVKLPKRFVPPLLIAEVLQALVRKGRRRPQQLLDLPEMTDERLRTVVRLISAVGKAAYQVRPEICVSVCTRAVNLCLAHGNTPDAAISYMVFGCIFLGGIVGRAETGYEFGRLSLDLVDKFSNEKQRAEVHFVVGYFGTSWMRPVAEAERLWAIAYEEGQRTGDLFHTGCAAAGTVQSMVMRGAPLAELESSIDIFWPVLERAHLTEPMTCLSSTRALVAALRDPEVSAWGADVKLLADLDGFGSRHFAHFHYLNQCMFHALRGDTASGLAAAGRSARYLPDSKGLLNTPEHWFWAAVLQCMDGSGKSAASIVRSVRKKFSRWAARCPANFSLRYELLCAEEERLRGRTIAALERYRNAAGIAERDRVLHLLGFAHRRVADLLKRSGRDDAAQASMEAARQAWAAWGALALASGAAPPLRRGGARR